MKKFSLKAAAVAAAMVVSGVASAATSGDLYVVVYDGANDTFVADLGAVPTTATAAATVLGSLSSLAGWSTFLSDAGGSLSSSDSFLLVGGATRQGDISFGTAPTSAPSQSQLNTIFGANVTTVLTNTLNGLGAGTTSADLTGSGAGTWTNLGGSTNFGSLVPNGTVGGALGAAQTLINFGSGGAISTVSSNVVLGTNGSFTVGTVPEPGTYALMVAGLLAVGAIVLRRARG